MKGSAGFFGLRLDRLNGHNIRFWRLSGGGAADDRSAQLFLCQVRAHEGSRGGASAGLNLSFRMCCDALAALCDPLFGTLHSGQNLQRRWLFDLAIL